MTTDGLPGFPTAPDIGMRDVPAVPASHLCDGWDMPPVRNTGVEPRLRDGDYDALHRCRYCARKQTEDHAPDCPSISLKGAAHELVEGERQRNYGEPTSHMRRVAEAWSAVLNRPWTCEEVALALATLKLVREGYKPERDNRLDAVGYLDILERLHSDGP